MINNIAEINNISEQSLFETIDEIKKRINNELKQNMSVKPKMKTTITNVKHKTKKVKSNVNNEVNSNTVTDWLENNPIYLDKLIGDYIRKHITVQVVPYGAMYCDNIGFFVELRIDDKIVSRSLVPIKVQDMRIYENIKK